MGWPTESFEIAEKELETLANNIDRRELHYISDPPQTERRKDYRKMIRVIREAADTARQLTEKHRQKETQENGGGGGNTMDYFTVAKSRLRNILTSPDGDTLGVIPDIIEPLISHPHLLQLLLIDLLDEFEEEIDYDRLFGSLIPLKPV